MHQWFFFVKPKIRPFSSGPVVIRRIISSKLVVPGHAFNDTVHAGTLVAQVESFLESYAQLAVFNIPSMYRQTKPSLHRAENRD